MAVTGLPQYTGEPRDNSKKYGNHTHTQTGLSRMWASTCRDVAGKMEGLARGSATAFPNRADIRQISSLPIT